MIRLRKTAEPAALALHADRWRDEYLALLALRVPITATVAQRYKHPEIKDALRVETADKCAYCESKIRHVAPEHVEHLVPKSVRPDLYVDWGNLTLACPVCNQHKGAYYSTEEPLLNPYEEEPFDHLLFAGPLVLSRPTSTIGSLTVKRLQLSRAELVERRQERIERLHPLVEQWAREERPNMKDLLQSEVRRECSTRSEYSAVVREYLRAAGFPVDHPTAHAGPEGGC